MKKFNGFTLAEVLITLGIIGVVAAMTMPTLINQTNGAQYRAAYKKALSAISQGVTLNVALEDKSFADESAETFLPTRMNVVKNTTTAPSYYTSTFTANNDGKIMTDADTFLYFNDSSMLAIKKEQTCTLADGATTKSVCEGFVDVNGDKGPNKVVTCSTGTTLKDTVSNGKITPQAETTACEVVSPTDIYPVYYYDQTILPATNAGRAVLYGK